MKEDVSVRVCGVQRCPGAEEDVSELVCEGVFKHTADGWLLAYEEPSEAGTVKTLLRFADGRVTLTRRGQVPVGVADCIPVIDSAALPPLFMCI